MGGAEIGHEHGGLVVGGELLQALHQAGAGKERIGAGGLGGGAPAGGPPAGVGR